LRRCAECEFGDGVFASLAEHEGDAWLVGRVPRLVVCCGEIEVEFAHVLGLGLPRFELDDDVATELGMVEDEVDPQL
jgi:hypothetical protein